MTGASIGVSTDWEAAIPLSTIASLSSEEFVGIVADHLDQQLPLKTFHARLANQVKDRKPYLHYLY